MRIAIRLLLAIYHGLRLDVHRVERLDGLVDVGDAVAELVERVLLALHRRLGTGGSDGLKTLGDFGGVGGDDRAVRAARLADHRRGLNVHELVVLLELDLVTTHGLCLGKHTELLEQRKILLGDKCRQRVGGGAEVAQAARLGLLSHASE